MLEAKDVSISVKLGTKYVYVSLDELTENERQTLFECLKNGDFERAGHFMNQNEKTHELHRTKGYPNHERHRIAERKFEQQKSLGMNEDFGAEPDVETVYQKAKEGDEKSLRMIGAWAQQDDQKAINFLRSLEDQRRKPMQRKRVIIP